MITPGKAPHVGLVLLLCMAVAFTLSLPVLPLSFFADDFLAVWRIGVLGERSVSFFRPLSELTLWINHLVVGTSPAGYRAFNVMVHAVNGTLLYLLVKRVPGLQEQRHTTGMALVAAALFLVYPYHNESVIWIVGRGTSIATLFTLTGLVILNSGMTERAKLLLVLACYFLGALAYESMLLFPVLIVPLLFRGCDEQRPFRKRLFWLLIATTILHFLIRWAFTGQIANAYGNEFFGRPWSAYPLNAAKVLGRLFLPPSADEHTQLVRFGLLVTLLVVAASLFWRRFWNDRSLRSTVLDLLWMLGISGLVGVIAGVSTRTSESDRFLYMPSAFLCVLIATILFTLLHGFLRWTTVVLLLIGSFLLLQRDNANWIAASATIERIVKEVPGSSTKGRLFVNGLPEEVNGAFVLRHGFHEALLLAGRDTTRTIRADTLLWGLRNERGVPALSNEDREDTVFVGEGDRIISWAGDRFVELE